MLREKLMHGVGYFACASEVPNTMEKPASAGRYSGSRSTQLLEPRRIRGRPKVQYTILFGKADLPVQKQLVGTGCSCRARFCGTDTVHHLRRRFAQKVSYGSWRWPARCATGTGGPARSTPAQAVGQLLVHTPYVQSSCYRTAVPPYARLYQFSVHC